MSGKRATTRSAPETADLMRASELARRADDLPDHGEAEQAGEREACDADPLEAVHAHDDRRRQQQRRDDDRRADAVRDRAEVRLELTEARRLHADLETTLLDLAQDVPDLPR